jgi:DNA polymerase
VVFGEGNPTSDILLIGEAPGRQEDLKAKPFVGRSGKLLDEMLELNGFSREENVFISNIVKCRPPENRLPTNIERVTCIPWLNRQIEIIDPKIIVLLGATALNGLIDKQLKISKVRGTWIQWNERIVMPVYHPAAILRNPKRKETLIEDFKKIADVYNG